LRSLVALLVAVGVALTAPAGAGAAVGQIGYDGCLASDASQNCGDLFASPLDGAYSVAVSPDGNSAYVASSGGTVSHFFLTRPGGQLNYDGCLGNDAVQNCVDLPAAPLTGATAVAVSSDSSSVYAVAALAGTVSHFFVSKPGGQITYDGCLGNDASQGCVDLPGAPLDGALGVAASPDGGSLYVVSPASRTLSHYFIAKPGGQITYDGCLGNDASQGCADLPGAPLTGAAGVAVSPDGASVYVASQGANTVSHYFVSKPGGQISYDGCFGNDASQGCVALPGGPLGAARDVAVSPDGSSVYVVSASGNSIAHFFVLTPGGQMVYDGCLANDDSHGCVDIPKAPLTGAHGVSVSPDGSSVYVVSDDANSISHFVVNKPGGQLTYDGCLANDSSQGCGDLLAAPLTSGADVATSPDGRSVYATAYRTSSVLHFFRSIGAGGPGGSVTTPGKPQPGATTLVAPRFRSARMTNRRFAVNPSGDPETLVSARVRRGTTFVYSLSKAAGVVFRIERPASGRKVGKSCRKPSRRNRHARPCTRYLKVGAFAVQGLDGTNRKAWSGKLGKRGIAPGRYRATLTATNPGTSPSTPRQLSFKVVSG
jgi:DNA-binding beta-propeller fold protein YncE